MKGLKCISVLLLVNISILVGHNLVPHHHHVISVDHPLSNECPETHKCPTTSHEHHEKASGTKHCHAFNNIVFVKYSHSQIPIPEKLSSFLIIRDSDCFLDRNSNIPTASGFILKWPILSSELTGNHALRGPPVLS